MFLLKLHKELLCMGSRLGWGPAIHMLLDLLPFLPIDFERLKEFEVLYSCPSSLIVALTWRNLMITSYCAFSWRLLSCKSCWSWGRTWTCTRIIPRFSPFPLRFPLLRRCVLWLFWGWSSVRNRVVIEVFVVMLWVLSLRPGVSRRWGSIRCRADSLSSLRGGC